MTWMGKLAREIAAGSTQFCTHVRRHGRGRRGKKLGPQDQKRGKEEKGGLTLCALTFLRGEERRELGINGGDGENEQISHLFFPMY